MILGDITDSFFPFRFVARAFAISCSEVKADQ